VYSFSLDEVCKTHNLGRKKEVSKEVLLAEHNTPEELNQIGEYCLNDVMITRQLFKFLCKEFRIFRNINVR